MPLSMLFNQSTSITQGTFPQPPKHASANLSAKKNQKIKKQLQTNIVSKCARKKIL